MTLRDLTTLARDLAGYNSGVLRARAAYYGSQQVAVRRCECSAPITTKRAWRCDPCRARVRKKQKATYDAARYQRRKNR